MTFLTTVLNFRKSLETKNLIDLGETLAPHCVWEVGGFAGTLEGKESCVEYLSKILKAFPDKLFGLDKLEEITPNEFLLDYYFNTRSLLPKDAKAKNNIGTFRLIISENLIVQIVTSQSRKLNPPTPSVKKQAKIKSRRPKPPAITYDPITGLPLK